jgi:hypothetical protein
MTRDPSQSPERRFWTEEGRPAFDFDLLATTPDGTKAFKLKDGEFTEIKEHTDGTI